MEFPDEQTMKLLAASYKSETESQLQIKAISNGHLQPHPKFKNVSTLNYNATSDLQQSSNSCSFPLSVLVKKVTDGSNEIQIYSSLFRDIQPTAASTTSSKSKPNIYSIMTNPNLNFAKANLYNLLPRVYLIKKPYIFMENLEMNSSFKTLDSEDQPGTLSPFNLDFGHCLVAIETLARFHAISYLYRKQLGLKGKGKLEMLQKYPFLNQQTSPSSIFSTRNCPKLNPIYEKGFEIALNVIEAEDPSLAFKLRRKFSTSSVGIFERCVKLLEEEKYDNDDFYVVCHGSLLPQNLLFAYGADSQDRSSPSKPTPEECKMINFDSVFFGPLASDLALFMLFSTTLEFRVEFEEKLLAFYCDAFQEQLTKIAGISNSLVSDFEENIDEFHRKLEKQYRKMMEFAFYNVCVLLPLTLFRAEKHKRNYSNNNNNNTKTVRDNNYFIQSIYDLIDDHKNVLDEMKEDKEFENFAVNNAFLSGRLVEILRQLQRCRVLL